MKDTLFYQTSRIRYYLFSDFMSKMIVSKEISYYEKLVEDILWVLEEVPFYADERVLQNLKFLTDRILLRFHTALKESTHLELFEKRKLLLRKIRELKELSKKEDFLKSVIEKERISRMIPSSIPLSIKEIAFFYQRDFEVLLLINFPRSVDEERPFSLFHVLSVIHKMYTECPVYIEERESYVQGLLEEIYQKERIYLPEDIVKYYEITKRKLEQSQEARRNNVIDFTKAKRKKIHLLEDTKRG